MLITLFRYFIVGCLATVLHLLILYLLVEFLFIDALIATSTGFIIAVIFNYICQYHWTFKAEGPHKKTFFRFISVALTMLALNALLFWVMTENLLLPYLIAQLIATGVVFICNFGINRSYTFKTA